MRGLLVYTSQDAKLNKWFIEHLTKEAEKQGTRLELVVHNDDKAFNAFSCGKADFCINRSRFAVVNRSFEALGVPCFNNLKTVEIANDKYKTYELCRALGVPVMETCLLEKEGAEGIGYPCVLKSTSGHGGQEVFWVECQEDLQKVKIDDSKQYIIQKPCSHTGVDVRVYVLGGEIVAGVKRTSAESFRSNFTLGGKAELFDVTSSQREIISVLQRELNTDYAGFDFILNDGEWVLNEIEDAVGARMLYSLCDFDIARMYMQYILQSV